MILLYRIPFNPLSFNTQLNTKPNCFGFKLSQPINCSSNFRPKITSFFQTKVNKGILGGDKLGFFGGKVKILKEEARKRKKCVVFNSLNGGPGFNGGGGGGWKVDDNTKRILGNLALAVGLTYLSVTGQLGWILDTILSIGLLAVIIPIVGIGAFIWWAGKDVVQDTCPNCKNEFQTFKSMLGDDMQLCPYCGEPFSVVGNKFVQDSANFSSRSTPLDQAFGDFTPRSKKGNGSSKDIVDVEAEVVDAD